MSKFEFNGSFSSLPDPQEYRPEPLEDVGRAATGKPIQQGYEEGTCYWEVISQAAWAELWNRYYAAKNAAQSAKIPPKTTGSMGTYRSVTCWGHEPQVERQETMLVYGVTFHLSKIQ